MATVTENLAEKCREIRYNLMDMIGHLGVGHVGGSLSIVETMVLLYYKYMRLDPRNPKKEGRDRFILSKGHAGPTLYAILADKGFFPKELLYTLNQGGTNLPSHPDVLRTPGVDMTTGSLGQGLSIAVGVAAASRLKKDGARIYSVVGDGECQEGQIWEAAMYAAHLKLDNLVAFVDFNGLQIDGRIDEINGIEPLDKKWEAFGWDTQVVDGHDLDAIDAAIDKALKSSGKPCMIILKTTKGKGVSFIEEAGTGNHNMPIPAEKRATALEELRAGGR